MAGPIGLYTLNEFDLYDSFGFAVASGSNDFLKMPTRKDPLSNKWADQNGTEYDLSNPFFDDAPAVLKGTIIADSESDFWSKYYALWALLKSEGMLTLYINEFDRNFYVFYKAMTAVTRLTRIKETGKIGVNIEITLQNISAFFDDVPPYNSKIVNVDTYADLPQPGEVGTLYITDDNNHQYRWDAATGSYKPLQIEGTTDNLQEGAINLYYTDARVQTFSDTRYLKLSTAASTYVPYTGATQRIVTSYGLSTMESLVFTVGGSDGSQSIRFNNNNGTQDIFYHNANGGLAYQSAGGNDFHVVGNFVADSAQVYKTPSTSYDVVRLTDLTSNIGSYLRLSGGTLTGDVQQTVGPVNANSLITKNYVDNLISGITWKKEVRVATIINITLSGTQTVDNINLLVGDRILVKNQSTASQNGIYVVAAGAWTRATDADTTDEIVGATVMVRLGTNNKDTQWTNTNSNEPVIGTDTITFGQISGAGTYTNGTGILLSSNVFSLNTTYTDGLYARLGSINNWAGAVNVFSNEIRANGGVNMQYNTGSEPAISWQNLTTGFPISIQPTAPTASRVITIPDATGTLALTSDITSSISGTAKYIPIFTGANTIGNSLIYQTAGFVGIGTITPSRPFTVVANQQEVMLMTGNLGHGLMLQDLSIGASMLGYNGATYNPIEFRAQAGSGTQLNIATNGNIGIGTNSPLAKLDIRTGATGGILINSTTTATLPTDYASLNTIANSATTLIYAVRDATVTAYTDFVSFSGSGATRMGVFRFFPQVGNSTIQEMSISGSGVAVTHAVTAASLKALGTTEQLRLSYDASNYNSFTVGSTGALTYGQNGTTKWSIDANGYQTITGKLTVNNSVASANVVLTANGATGQTGNLQNWSVNASVLASIDKLGSLTSSQFKLSALNTAPASATDTGVLGEIRLTSGFIYLCTATNTWVRAALATF